ncbi:type II toxin-antitoxin system RelB family antitoxin [Exiguobacterium sp. USCH10]|uniref:type II toxin-antitoxin system RelB family antitoxin n=1 Tax=Exiguobacterium sp. USCH10 TaxID=3024839 RepID=UPI0030964955
METINIHLNEEDVRFIKEYVEAKQLHLSIFIRDVMIEHIQNERDLNRYHETMYHHQKASKAISFEEMMKELDEE